MAFAQLTRRESLRAGGSDSFPKTSLRPHHFDRNSSFTISLAEGDYQVGVRGLPLGYVLKSITVGDVPLTALKIAPGSPDPSNIVITLASISLESIQGVKVSGRITGLPTASLAGTGVILIGTNTKETTANADGTFEFAKVPQGTYNARLDRVPPNGIVNPLATRFVVGPTTLRDCRSLSMCEPS